jgi:cysteine-rich repeat protein
MRSRVSFLFTLGCLLLAAVASRAVDDPDELLPGVIGIVKTGTLFKFVAKPDPNPFALPSPGNDPTVGGAILHVFDTGIGAGDGTYTLAAANWKGLGNPPGSKGFKYKGDGSFSDPCKVVLVKPKVVKAVCKGGGVTFTPPYVGDLGIELTLGTSSKRYCARFGGENTKNEAGFLKRKDAPAVACAGTTTTTSSTTTTSIFTVCGDGLTQGIEQCDDGNTSPGDGCDAICQIEETTSGSVSGGGTVTSDDEADGATAADPLETSVTSPNAGSVTIFESSPGAPPTGYEFRGQAAYITAPDASSSSAPLDLQFDIDASQIRPGENEDTVQVFRSGVLVSACLGAPGTAVPEPCVAQRTLLGGGDVRLRVFATHTSPWSFGYPLCGNGMLDGGEACDPPAGGCGGGQTCKSDCTCGAVCDCCAGAPGTLTISHGTTTPACGTMKNSSGAIAFNLNCNTVYFGGGGDSVPPFVIPDGELVLKVNACSSADETLTLGPTTSAETGNVGSCSSAGCRFGAPLSVPNPSSTPTSSCVVPTVSQDVSGLASCGGVISQLGLPLTADIYLTGDTATDPSLTIPGIQPCPLCSSGTCIGGPNNGLGCTPGTAAINAGYPTSNDCPPDPMFFVGSIPVGANLTTGAVNWTATVAGNDTGSTANAQTRVFAGWCRDADGTGSFQNPAHQCWENGLAVGTPCSGIFESCRQRNNGAFGPAGGANRTIDQIGSAPGCLADELPHAAQVIGPIRIPPSFNATIDAAADLPGPGTFGLDGNMQIQ